RIEEVQTQRQIAEVLRKYIEWINPRLQTNMIVDAWDRYRHGQDLDPRSLPIHLTNKDLEDIGKIIAMMDQYSEPTGTGDIPTVDLTSATYKEVEAARVRQEEFYRRAGREAMDKAKMEQPTSAVYPASGADAVSPFYMFPKLKTLTLISSEPFGYP